MATLSASTPSAGLVSATKAVERAMPTLQVELPVNVIPRNDPLSPRLSLKANTK